MSPRKTQNKRSNWSNIEFANIRLTEENKHEFESWANALGDGAFPEIDVMICEGWKTSIKWDDTNDCFIVSSTMEDENNRNYQICVSSRSDVSLEAYLLNVYKIQVLYKNQKLPTEAVKQNWG